MQQLYNTVDTIIVGNFSGEDALSAVGITGSFAFLFLVIAIGFSSGNGVVVAQHYGAGDERRVRFQFGYNIFSSILRAVGDSAATLYFLLIASVLNIILYLVFVAGFYQR